MYNHNMIYVLANRKRTSGKKQKVLNAVKNVFDKNGLDYEIIFTEKRGEAKALTQKITSDGNQNVLVIMGGDGTLHDVINGFCDFENNSVAVIPVGTGNDFAECAKIPKDPVKAAGLVINGEARAIDYIQLSSGLRSLNAIGAGIDVDVLKRTYSGKSKGKSKYVKALISSLIHFKSCNFTVRYNGKEEKRFGLIAAIGNGRQIGGGIKLFPEARLDDGYLDLFIVDYLSKPKILGAFLKLMRGKVNKIKGATAVKVKSAEFIMDADNYTVQAEGELYDNIPVNAEVVAGKFKIYMPEKN